MINVPGTEYIHFQKSTGNYFISKKVDGVQHHFGTYSTLDEAIKYRDYFQKNNWRLTERLHYSKSEYIRQLPSGRYCVEKQRDGTSVSYGTFDNLEEAEHQVRLCKSFGWDLRLKPFDCMKYIRAREMAHGRVVYRIEKEIQGDTCYFGTFNNLDDAKYERDLLVLCGWDYDALASINEVFDDDRFLEGKLAKSNFIYNPPNGRIDYGVL